MRFLVQPPVQECAEAVHFLDFQHSKFPHLGVGLGQCGDGPVFAIGVDENIHHIPFVEGVFFLVAGEQHPLAAFQF